MILKQVLVFAKEDMNTKEERVKVSWNSFSLSLQVLKLEKELKQVSIRLISIYYLLTLKT